MLISAILVLTASTWTFFNVAETSLSCATCDADGDGVTNEYDLDDDNDGIPDLDEMVVGSAQWTPEGYEVGTDYQPSMLATGLIGEAPNQGSLNFLGVEVGNPRFNFLQVADDLGGGSVQGVSFRGSQTTGPDDAMQWTLDFNQPTFNIDLYFGDLDFSDRVITQVFYQGEEIDVLGQHLEVHPSSSELTYISPNIISSDGNGSNTSASYLEAFRFRFPGPVDSVAFTAFKHSGSNSNVTLYITELTYSVPRDTDQDGVWDHEDLDADNDGIQDLVEAGGVDRDANGRVDNFNDADEDGLADEFDNDDTDGPGATDCSYPIECDLSGSTSVLLDQDGDGNQDYFADLDGDGIPHYRDLDSDGDGIADVIEMYGVGSDNDETEGQDGRVDGQEDADEDEDGWHDSYPGRVETQPDQSTAEYADNVMVDFEVGLGNPDHDGDGIPNFLDLDSDGDGISDLLESQASSTELNDVFSGLQNPSGRDTDGDGLDDAFDLDQGSAYIIPIDTDDDGLGDYLDSDSDNDGKVDLLEGHDADFDDEADLSPSGSDLDQDGLDDAFDSDVSSANPRESRQSLQDQDDDLNDGGDRDWRDLGGTILPVEWSSMKAEWQGNKAKLSWQTESETQTHYFEIQRSGPASEFRAVGRVEATGDSHTQQSYQYVDLEAVRHPAKRYLYRIRQVDLD
ncbi:MAG: hypothetical protein AAF804_11200, partial [Bacteroidota bacterium]